jgi:hypothetical protein
VPAAETFAAFGAQLFAAAPVPPAVAEPGHPQFAHVPAPSGAWGPSSSRSLGADFTVGEIYLATFGSTGLQGNAFPFVPCNGCCSACFDFMGQLVAAASGDGPRPEWSGPSLHTSTASGNDGLRTEWLRWARATDGSTFDLRMRLATVLTDIINKVQRDGLLDEFSVSLVHLLLKSAKPGMHLDPAKPESYRTLFISSLVSKVLALAATTRMSHYAEDNGLLQPEMAGFRAGQSAEHHAFALSELLHARRRLGKRSYAVYIDFRAAFDKVSAPALEAVFAKMGMPEPLLALLRRWRSGATASMVVNGTAAPPFPVLGGVPQGLPASPLWFNLFIASLSRFLAACPELRGAGALGAHIFRLFYADDVCIVAESAAELQLALDRVHEWATAWGMVLSVGRNKTEAQFFPALHDADFEQRAAAARAAVAPAAAAHAVAKADLASARAAGGAAPLSPGDAVSLALGRCLSAVAAWRSALCVAALRTAAAPPPLPALQVGGQPVEWTTEYRYLGLALRSDLDSGAAVERLASGTRAAFGRFFGGNEVVRRMPVGLQLHILRCHVLSVAEYLRGVSDLTGKHAKKFDVIALAAARGILGFPKNAAVLLIFALSGLIPARLQSLRAAVRTRLQLENLPSPAGNVLRALAAERPHPLDAAAFGPDANFAHVLRRALTEQFRAGVRLRPLGSPGARAKLFARDAACVEFQQQLRAVAAGLGLLRPPSAAPAASTLPAAARAALAAVAAAGGPAAADAAARLAAAPAQVEVAVAAVRTLVPYSPPPMGTAKFAAYLFYNEDFAPASLGDDPDDNPMSAVGPGLCSPIAAVMDGSHRPWALLAALLGGEAMARYPFCPGLARPRPGAGARVVAYGDRFAPRSCRLCGVGEESVYHLLFDCASPALAAAAAVTVAETRARVRALWSAAERACIKAGTVMLQPVGTEHEALARFIAGGTLPPDETRFLVFRVLLAAPFPASVARRHGFDAAAGLGVIFSSMKVRGARRTCTQWVSWADRRLTAIADLWKAAAAAAAQLEIAE